MLVLPPPQEPCPCWGTPQEVPARRVGDPTTLAYPGPGQYVRVSLTPPNQLTQDDAVREHIRLQDRGSGEDEVDRRR